MERPTDLKRVLAEEIHAAIAESAPAPAELRDAGDPATADARGALRRAAELLTPSVPSGAPLEPLKRLAVRALRFLWRNQATFNSLSLDAAGRLAESVDRSRAELDALAHRARVQEARLTVAESAPSAVRAAGATAPAATTAEPSFPPGVYALFEERFRGSPAEIARGQREYLGALRGVPGPVLDVGCGRGEFLRLLTEAGIAGSGLESNPVSVQACRSAGLTVEEGDALALLARKPPAALGGVVAFQVVEHWPPGASSGSCRRRGACWRRGEF